MRARVDNAIHVQVQVVEFFTVRVGASGINRNDRAIIHGDGLVFDDRRDDLGVFGRKPSESRGNTHVVRCGGRGASTSSVGSGEVG